MYIINGSNAAEFKKEKSIKTIPFFTFFANSV